MSVHGPAWNSEPLYPATLLGDSLEDARLEFTRAGEYFYSSTNFPVVTPTNAIDWAQAMQAYSGQASLWSLCSGSSRTSALMMSAPNRRLVLFPVDSRYGWDLCNYHHQYLLKRVDAMMLPQCVMFEVPSKTTESVVAFLLSLLMQVGNSGRRFLAEHALRVESHSVVHAPLLAIRDLKAVSVKKTSFVLFRMIAMANVSDVQEGSVPIFPLRIRFSLVAV